MVGSSWTLPLSACLLSILAGCASTTTYRSVHDLTAEERERLMVRPEDAARGRDCSVDLETPPSFAELADSAAIQAELVRRLPELDSSVGPIGRAVLTIQVDSTGDVAWTEVVSSNLPDTALTFFSGLFPGRVKTRTRDSEEGPRREGWTFRIGVDIDRSLAFNVGRPVYCTPQMRNQEQVRAKLNAMVNLYGLDVSGAGRTTLLWIFTGEDGRPERMQVRRSSGNPALDQIAQHAAADAIFDTATADGHPLKVWVAIPFNFAPQARPQRR